MENSSDKSIVKPSLLYIFLGSIFLFAIILFLASCTIAKKKAPQHGLRIISATMNDKFVVAPQDFAMVQ